jgi:guanine nucleotide-binding protein subunit alpha
MLSGHVEALKQKLQPLKHIEQLLIAKLVPPNEEEATHFAPPSNPYIPGVQQASYRSQEIFIRPGQGWRGALSRARVTNPGFGGNEYGGSGSNGRPMSAGNTGLETQDEPQAVLHKLKKEMVQLWEDPLVKEVLRRKKIKLEQESGLYVLYSLAYRPSFPDFAPCPGFPANDITSTASWTTSSV